MKTVPIYRVCKQRTVPDWEPNQAVLWVWPQDLKKREHLCSLYAKLLKIAAGHVHVILLVKNKQRMPELESYFLQQHPKLRLTVISTPSINDIWIRDYGFFCVRSGTENNRLVQFQYAPSYVHKQYRANAKDDSDATKCAAVLLGFAIQKIPLVLDGGAITHNGRGIAVLTQKAIDEAAIKAKLFSHLSKTLGFKQFIVVPHEPGDVTGHVDGIIRFLTPKTVAVVDYPRSYSIGHEYSQSLSKQLHVALGPRYKIVLIPCSPPSSKKSEGIPSAAGNYLNFVWLGKRLVVPQYGTNMDQVALLQLKAVLPQTEILGFTPELTKRLASLGGILNCITTTVPVAGLKTGQLAMGHDY